MLKDRCVPSLIRAMSPQNRPQAHPHRRHKLLRTFRQRHQRLGLPPSAKILEIHFLITTTGREPATGSSPRLATGAANSPISALSPATNATASSKIETAELEKIVAAVFVPSMGNVAACLVGVDARALSSAAAASVMGMAGVVAFQVERPAPALNSAVEGVPAKVESAVVERASS